MKAAAILIFLAILAGAILSNYQHKPFELLISEAGAVTIVCNPVFVPDIPKYERRKVVKV